MAAFKHLRIGVTAAVAVLLPMFFPLTAVADPVDPQPFELTLPVGEEAYAKRSLKKWSARTALNAVA